jgi:hypothetical protein
VFIFFRVFRPDIATMKWYKLMIIRLVSARGSYPRAAKEDAAHAREAPHPMGDWAWVKPKDKGFGP